MLANWSYNQSFVQDIQFLANEINFTVKKEKKNLNFVENRIKVRRWVCKMGTVFYSVFICAESYYVAEVTADWINNGEQSIENT